MTSFRPIEFGITRGIRTERPDGTILLEAAIALRPYAERLTDRFIETATQYPERIWLARKASETTYQKALAQGVGYGREGSWITLPYGVAWQAAQSVAQALLNRHLDAERPVMILSENSIEHGLLALACMVAGVPFVPVSPAYSLLSTDFDKLKHVLSVATPGLVFIQSADRYGAAVTACIGAGVEVVWVEEPTSTSAPIMTCSCSTTSWSDLCHTTPTPQVMQAWQQTHADTIVKFLFTSGSTKLPKAVINTHRMWCANQEQMSQSMPVITQKPLVLLDWLPWNHTFGGNHNFGMSIYQGGTLYLDDGKPTPALVGITLENLKEIAPTVYFNVPTGFEAIARAMEHDTALRRHFLSRVQMLFYAGAGLAQPVWDSLYASEEIELGQRIVMTSGLGMTESGPFGLFVTHPHSKSGDLGLPTAGMVVKLVQQGDKWEVRYRGPNITVGYWRNPEETQLVFDEEGFFCSGDAVQWIDPHNPHLGLRFDGRIAEDFKLATGTFVSVGPLRGRIIASMAPYVQDVVITGLNRHEVGAMLFPTPALRQLADASPEATLDEVIQTSAVRQWFQERLDALAAQSTGSSTRIARLTLLTTPPSLDRGEITDKGSINQRAVLSHRADWVAALYDDTLPFLLKPNR